MKVGTKSVIFGVHCILIHPFFVAWAWSKLYGFPWDFRIWLACFLHDVGYAGKREMESVDGQDHVILGGRLMGWFFGSEWRDFVMCHSRHWAKRVGKRYSKLCVADKLAFVLTPAWLYLPMARMSGELWEYMRVAATRQSGERFSETELILLHSSDPRVWLEGLKSYTRRWVERHRNGDSDHWTVVRSGQGQGQACESRG